jgi:hypothetical protein
MIGPVDQQLDQPIVFEDGDPRLALAAVDEDLAFQAGCP